MDVAHEEVLQRGDRDLDGGCLIGRDGKVSVARCLRVYPEGLAGHLAGALGRRLHCRRQKQDDQGHHGDEVVTGSHFFFLV